MTETTGKEPNVRRPNDGHVSETTTANTPQILVFGPPPDDAQTVESDVRVRYLGSSHEMRETLTERVPQIFICLHAPPRYDGIEAVKAVRKFDATVPVVLATPLQNTMVNLQALQTKVTWSVQLSADDPVEETLFDVVADASEWLEAQLD